MDFKTIIMLCTFLLAYHGKEKFSGFVQKSMKNLVVFMEQEEAQLVASLINKFITFILITLSFTACAGSWIINCHQSIAGLRINVLVFVFLLASCIAYNRMLHNSIYSHNKKV
jgi:ABC-type uncharacterized transport system fused permease/ATPase subunit